MSTALFPDGLTREAWDDLQYRCKQYDEADLDQQFNMADPAKGWVILTAHLIAIGAMRHIADPESYTGVALPGWTIWGRKKYANHIPAQVQQRMAFIRWAVEQGFIVGAETLDPEVGFPQGLIVFESFAFRDPDGKSAPVDASGLDGWTLYTGEVIPPKVWTEADAVKTRDDGQPVGDVTSNPSGAPDSDLVLRIPATTPAPQPPAVKVGDRVLAHLLGAETRTAAVWYVREHTRNGTLMSRYPEATQDCWCLCTPLEVLPPRPTEG